MPVGVIFGGSAFLTSGATLMGAGRKPKTLRATIALYGLPPSSATMPLAAAHAPRLASTHPNALALILMSQVYLLHGKTPLAT
jgi:hypothetical protein